MSDVSPLSPPNATLPALVAAACRWRHHQPLLCDAQLRLTGRDCTERLARLDMALEKLGVGSGTTVAILAGSAVATALVLFAASARGATCCFLHTYEREENNADVLRAIDARLLIAGPQDIYRGKGERIAAAADIALAMVDAQATGLTVLRPGAVGSGARRPIVADDPAMLLLSSGTTGKPKVVVHTHRTLVAVAGAGTPIYGRCTEDDRIAVGMQPSFAAWIFTMLPFFTARALIVFSEWTNADDYLALLARERITMAALVPTVWRMVLAAGPEAYDLAALQVAFFSGEPGSQSLVEALARIAPDVRTAYLASEIGCACGIAAGLDVLRQPGKAACVGRPVPGGDVRLIDPESATLRDVAPGETGEIAVRGPSLAQGYWNNEPLTAARFGDGWWRSGDLGQIDADGYVFVKGRLDNRINSGGIKIHAEEVEAVLLSHPQIAMAAVVGEPDEQWGERVVAHVVARNGSLTVDAVLAHCAGGTLSSRKIPKAVYFHDRLPTGPTNKLLRQALRQKGRSDAQ